MFPQRYRAFILDEYLPHVRQTGCDDLLVTVDIVEDKDYLINNEELKCIKAFEEVKAYLNSACSRDSLDLYADGTFRGDSFLFSLRTGEEVADSFRGVSLRWLSGKINTNNTQRPTRFLRLKFPQQHRALVLNEYLPHVRREGRDIMIGKRGQRLYTYDMMGETRSVEPHCL
ncbi:hypothetical protein PVAP13_1KG168105 [Panicum virgatum]|uniref:AAA-type ATPase N-terminal domain-containing protein n=1 Tax=Panicum virgatum TaxID=38727 RepID=A0A8T0XIS2_PANVG|nr:hypothetical protein PVAP13_1KG168105 [Panicum virgatum]